MTITQTERRRATELLVKAQDLVTAAEQLEVQLIDTLRVTTVPERQLISVAIAGRMPIDELLDELDIDVQADA